MRGTGRSASAVVDRGVTITVLFWQGAWLVLGGGALPTSQNSVGLMIVASLPFLTGGALATTLLRNSRTLRWRPTIDYINVFAVILAGVAFSVAARGGAMSAGVGETMFELAAGISGLRLASRPALVCSAAVALMDLIIVLPGNSTAKPSDFIAHLTDATYIMAIGVSTTVLVGVLRRSASTTQQAHEILAEASTEAEVKREVERQAQADERQLHDTVLNALALVGRGFAPGQVDEVRAWCGQATEQLRNLDHTELGEPAQAAGHSSAIASAIDPDVSALIRRGVRVTIAERLHPDLPDEIALHLVRAAREVLRNVDRHAEASHVRVDIEPFGRGVRIRIADDGRGFDVRETPLGLGLSGSVIGVMDEISGNAIIRSRPSSGTSVILEWKPSTAAQERIRLLTDLRTSLRSLAPGYLAPFAVFAGLAVLGTSLSGARIVPDLVAYAIFLVASVILILGTRAGSVGWGRVVVVGTMAIAVCRIESFAVAGTGAQDSSWAAQSAIAILIVIIALGPRYVAVVAIAMWVVAQGLDPFELLRPGTAVLIAAALFQRSLFRQAQQYDQSWDEAIHAEAESAAAGESLRRRRARFRVLLWTTLPLLEGIAQGHFDPQARSVRDNARAEEQFVRTLVRIDPETDEVHAMVVRLAITGRRRGVVVDADVQPTGAVDDRSLRATAELLDRVVRALPPGAAPARLTGGIEGDDVVLRLVASLPETVPDLVRHEGFSDMGGTGLWEVNIVRA